MPLPDPEKRKDLPHEGLPQVDPQLALSEGRASAWQVALVGLGIVLILGLVIYGVNHTGDGTQTAIAPPAQTTGAGTPPEPAQQPVPEPAKPTTDGSQR